MTRLLLVPNRNLRAGAYRPAAGPSVTCAQFAARCSMHSLLEPGKGAASDERAISWLRDRMGAPLVEFHRLVVQDFSRLELRAKVRSYLSVLRVSDVRAFLRRKAAVAKGRSRMTTSLHDPLALVRLKQVVEALEQQWRERARNTYHRLARGYSGESM